MGRGGPRRETRAGPVGTLGFLLQALGVTPSPHEQDDDGHGRRAPECDVYGTPEAIERVAGVVEADCIDPGPEQTVGGVVQEEPAPSHAVDARHKGDVV